MIEIINVTKAYKSHVVIENLSLTISDKRTRLLGCNGVGKSVLLRLIAGLEQVSSGAIVHDGSPIDIVSDSIEYPASLLPVTIFEFYDSYKRCNIAYRDELVKKLNFTDFIYTKVSNLSSGNLQKLRLLLALSGSGNWLLLDEPYNGLDGQSQSLLTDLINSTAKSVVLVDHNIPSNLVGFSDIDLGRLIT